MGLGGGATGKEKLVVLLGRRGSRVSTFLHGIFGDKEVDWIGAGGVLLCVLCVCVCVCVCFVCVCVCVCEVHCQAALCFSYSSCL